MHRLNLILISLAQLLLAQGTPPFYSDKQNLLAYLDSRLEPRVVRSQADWAIRRSHIIQNMQQVMGPLPEKVSVPLDLQILSTTDLPGFTRQRVSFVSEVLGADKRPDRVSAFLLFPAQLKSGAKVPAILCLHQTTRGGKAEPAGVQGNPNLHYAVELAQRGYITLAPDYPNFGDYSVDPYAHGYASATMKGIVNHRRALDLLQSLPQVDPSRIGAIGHSLGGHNSLFLASFDERVKAVVTSCGFNSFFRYKKGDLTGWSHKGYMPRIAEVYSKDPSKMPFDFTEVLAVIVPRPVFISAPLRDANFEVSGVRDCVDSALAVYDRIFRARDRLVAHYPDAGHEFPPQEREEAYRFLDRWLK